MVRYIDAQLMYHLGIDLHTLRQMPDDEWAMWHAILADIRKNEKGNSK